MRVLIFFIVFFSIFVNPAYARWASFNDAALKFSRSIKINIDKEGKTEELVEMEAKILKESGRSVAARYILTYNAGNAKITIIEAKTIYKGKEYKIEKKFIEDKPLASSSNGFDQHRQILLAFPRPEIGAKIYLKYKFRSIKPELKNFYGEILSFGSNEFVEKQHIKLHSELPLHMLVNDPEKILKITKDKPDNFHDLEIILTKPFYKKVIEEPADNVLNSKYLTYVSLSNLKNWTDLGNSINIKGYVKIFKEALPKTFMKIAEEAAKKENETDQINTVTSLLNDKIQYIGDWRSVEGRLFPRTLKQTSESQLGDCKDFASATAAILSKLGYKTQIALVRRGIGNFYPNSLPDMGAFNHAIVKLVNKQGKILWIDPTNFVSMANGIFPDIAGKKSLVLDLKKSSYENIPNVSPEHAQTISTGEINILKDEEILEKGEVIIKNEKALMLTAAELRVTTETIKNHLFRALSGEDLEKKNKLNMILPDLKTRAVKDISIKYAYKQANKLLKTNLGIAIRQSFGVLNSFFNIPEYYVTDILVSDYPFSMHKKILIKNVNAKNIELLNKEIKTPWLYVSRKSALKENNLHIEYDVILYKNLIPNDVIRTSEFVKFTNELKKNFKDIAIILDR